jgi:ubiquinone/menaquinone biosynthesis C-methylase UbiE
MNASTFPEMYERWLVEPLFRPWAELIIEEVVLSPTDRVLDIACGTGIVARVARERLSRADQVVGVDISPDMLAVARAVAPDVVWRQGSADALPLLAEERFDAVVCQQGLQFFPDKPAAVAEMYRALAKGGRLAVATWRPDEEFPLLRELRRVAERHVGAIADRRYSYGEPAPLEALLREAGFRDVLVRTLSRTIRFEDGSRFLRLNGMALVGMSAAVREMADQERQRVLDEIIRESEPVLHTYQDGTGFAFELGINLATALASGAAAD